MIELHISIEPHPSALENVRRWFAEEYAPALRMQAGFRSASLLETYDRVDRQQIAATDPIAPLLLTLRFDGEERRAAWQASSEHERVWPLLMGMASFRQHTAWTCVDDEVTS